MAVKKRCIFCLKKLRADGTCQNPDCPRYTPEQEEQGEQAEQKETSQP